MRSFLAIYRRELAGLFLAPLAWILLCVTLFYNGFFFLAALEQSGGNVNASLGYLHRGPLWYLVAFLPPLLTMRMISEETRSGLLEFLLTAPVSDTAVMIGKLAAATSFMAIAWSSVLVFGLVVQLLGATPDWGQLCMEWLGAVFVSGLFSAIGLICSALSGTPLLAAFLAILSNLVLFMVPTGARMARGVLHEPALWIADRIDVRAHFDGSFQTGALDSSHVLFFVVWTALGVFLAVRIVESRRWMG